MDSVEMKKNGIGDLFRNYEGIEIVGLGLLMKRRMMDVGKYCLLNSKTRL